MMRSDERQVMQLMSPCKGLWEMESWVKWQESGVECPLAKVTGTSASDHDCVCVCVCVRVCCWKIKST